MQLSSDTVVQGGKVTVNTQGWQPGSTVQVWLRSDPLLVGSGIADAAGNATVEITVPADFPVGAHTVVMTGTSLGGVASEVAAGLTVTSLGTAAGQVVSQSGLGAAAATTTTSGSLPQTGSPLTVPLAATGFVLLAGGSALVLWRRRSVAESV